MNLMYNLLLAILFSIIAEAVNAGGVTWPAMALSPLHLPAFVWFTAWMKIRVPFIVIAGACSYLMVPLFIEKGGDLSPYLFFCPKY